MRRRHLRAASSRRSFFSSLRCDPWSSDDIGRTVTLASRSDVGATLAGQRRRLVSTFTRDGTHGRPTHPWVITGNVGPRLYALAMPDESKTIWHPVETWAVNAYHWLHQHVSPEGWSALGTWATVAVATVAAFFALHQVRELRLTRERQAQPNVVAFVRPDAKVYQFLDLVVANYGLTPAYHVKFDFPPLTVSPYQNAVTGEQVTRLHIPDEIAVLAPGQEWRTMWDSAIERISKRDELGSRFEGLVKFEDSRGNKFDNPAILDWDTHFDTNFVADKPDESAKAVAEKLSEISGVLKSYKSEHDGIWIYPVRADTERSYREAESAGHRAISDHITRALRGDHTPEPPGEQP
jgi:hypothetical protein